MIERCTPFFRPQVAEKNERDGTRKRRFCPKNATRKRKKREWGVFPLTEETGPSKRKETKWPSKNMRDRKTGRTEYVGGRNVCDGAARGKKKIRVGG